MALPIVTVHLPDVEIRLRALSLDDMIRVGRDHDGGYLLPRRLVDAADAVLALGLNDDWSFEEALVAMKPSLVVHGYDHSIGRRAFAREARYALAFIPLGKGTVAQYRARRFTVKSYDRFFAAPNRHYAQKITNRPTGPNEIDVNGALDRLDAQQVLVKMDIEGSEYRVIDQLVANADRIVGACIEFHDVEPFRLVFERALDALAGPFGVAHVHPNNYGKIAADGMPDVLEITFVNRRLLSGEPYRDALHLPLLDQANDPIKPDVALVHG